MAFAVAMDLLKSSLLEGFAAIAAFIGEVARSCTTEGQKARSLKTIFKVLAWRLWVRFGEGLGGPFVRTAVEASFVVVVASEVGCDCLGEFAVVVA